VPVYKRNPDNSIYAEVEDLSKRNTTHTFSQSKAAVARVFICSCTGSCLERGRRSFWSLHQNGYCSLGEGFSCQPWLGQNQRDCEHHYGTNGGTKINTARYAVTKFSGELFILSLWHKKYCDFMHNLIISF